MLILFLIVGFIAIVRYVTFFTGADGSSLKRKFSELGNMTGMSYYSIKNKVGKEDFSLLVYIDENNCYVKKWTRLNYSITLLFNADLLFISIVDEIETNY